MEPLASSLVYLYQLRQPTTALVGVGTFRVLSEEEIQQWGKKTMEPKETVTITVPVGGPVWAAWMLTQGKTLELPGSSVRLLFEMDEYSFVVESSDLGTNWRTANYGLSTLFVNHDWREYKPPQEPQGWDWAFAEMQAGRVVVFDGDLLVKLGMHGDFLCALSRLGNWRSCTLKAEMFTGKKWTSADES